MLSFEHKVMTDLTGWMQMLFVSSVLMRRILCWSAEEIRWNLMIFDDNSKIIFFKSS